MRLSTLLTLGFSTLALAAPAEDLSGEVSEPSHLDKRAHYFTSCEVTASALKYRTCASTSCRAVGQYSRGRLLQTTPTNLHAIPSWIKLKNGYYVSSQYCQPRDGYST